MSELVLLFILILANAYFAAAEIAFISLNDAKLDMQVKEGNKKAKSIKKILDNPSKFLATIQIGITLAGFLSSAFASEAFASELAPVLYGWIPYLSLEAWNSISIVLITVVLSYFTLILGELVPKRIAMKYYEKIAFGTVGVIKTIATFTAPFVKLLTFSTNVVSKLFGVSETEEETVTEAIIELLKDLTKNAVKTITCDRGKEFAGWKKIEKTLGTDMYFADPYCAWQKGTNENSNGLFREFYPKAMDLSKTTEKEVKDNLELLNNRPRKCINYKTPNEYFNECLSKCCT